jgi:hypothetical protein
MKQKSNLFQSRTIPIPLLPSPDPTCLTFMGRLANELVSLTNPRTTIFLPATQTWFDAKTLGANWVTRGPLFTSAIGANFDPQGRICPLRVKLSLGGEIVCLPLHSSKK